MNLLMPECNIAVLLRLKIACYFAFLFGLDDTPDGAFELDWHDYVVVVSQPAGAQIENIPNFDDIVKEKMRELTGE